jgi:hypothetical protein
MGGEKQGTVQLGRGQLWQREPQPNFMEYKFGCLNGPKK